MKSSRMWYEVEECDTGGKLTESMGLDSADCCHALIIIEAILEIQMYPYVSAGCGLVYDVETDRWFCYAGLL